MISVRNGGSGSSEILLGIRISNPPTKTSYIAGENLALAGMTVQSIKTDGDTETYEDITGWTTDKADGSILYENTTSIVISWVSEGKTYTASQTITVKRVLSSIAFTAQPTKTIYGKGETLDLTGATVTATFTSGLTEAVVPTYSPANGTVLSDFGSFVLTATYTENGITKTATTAYSVPPKIYGVKWNYANSATALTRLTTANDSTVNTDISTAATAGIGSTAGSSPFDNIYPWNEMDEYNVSGGAITVKHGEAGFSRANDTVVKIPKFYYKVVDNSSTSTRCFYISQGPSDGFTLHPAFSRAGIEKDAIYVGRYQTYNSSTITGNAPQVSLTRANFRTNATSKGSNWCQWDYASWCAIWMLYLVEFADWNSQTKIGQGYTAMSNASAAGGTDSMTYFTGRAAGSDGSTAVQYRHIENLWGNVYQWVDGINFNGSSLYVCTDPSKFADDTSTNYTYIGDKIDASGYIDKLNHLTSAPYAFAPGGSSGSASTYVPDYHSYSSGWHVLYVGGAWDGGLYAGLFYFSADSSSGNTDSSIGSRLLLIP